MQRATIPSNPAALLKPSETPDARDKTSLPIRTPRSPFPSGESTNKKSKDVTKPVTKATATIVEIDSEGLRSFVISALTTFNILFTRHFEKSIF